MPKNTVAGSSIADDDGVCRTFEEPLDVQRDDQGQRVEGGEESSPGKNSSGSTETQPQSSNTNGEPHQPPAPTTESPLPQEVTGDSGAGTTNSSSTESGATSQGDDQATTKTSSRKK